ncbi:MAG TPA: TlpA disulfide reductase family protein [Candidatus Acidoferrales bacterium]|nr:TlpA disulfide reductase family protein [Candidatus Acidoferrales bacterium]
MQAGRAYWPVLAIFLVAFLILAYMHRHGVKVLLRTLVFGQQTPVRVHLDLGEKLPAVSFVDLLGNRTNVAPQRGRVLVLNVFATWCPDCNQEAPALSQLATEYAGKPVDIIGIDQDEYPAVILAFARQYSWNFPIYIDHEHQTNSMLGVHFIPATFVMDDRGRVWANVAGPLTLAQMQQLVQTGLSRLSKRG